MKEMTVGLTCELLVTPLDAPLTRRFDDETGLKLLDKTSWPIWIANEDRPPHKMRGKDGNGGGTAPRLGVGHNLLLK